MPIRSAPSSSTSSEPRASLPFEQFAPFYDVVYAAAGKDYQREARDVLTAVRRIVPNASTLLDVGCGTGGHLRWWREDLQCTGVDRCDAMLDVARQTMPEVRFTHADMTSLQLGKSFDIVTCMFASLAYLPTPTDASTAIERMAAHLSEDGVLVMEPGVFLEDVLEPEPSELTCSVGEATVTRHTHAQITGDRLEIKFDLTIEEPGVPSRAMTEVHSMQLLARTEFERMLAAARFVSEAEPIDGRNQERFICRRV